jgi:hypothetical protein
MVGANAAQVLTTFGAPLRDCDLALALHDF